MNLDLQEKVKLWRSTDETVMLGKSQTFCQTTESGISGILSGKPENRRKTRKCYFFSSKLLKRDFRRILGNC